MSKGKYSLTAILYDKKGRILSIGKNSYVKTHPLQAYHAHRVQKDCKIYLHAEIDAIVKCQDLRKAHTIRVMRFSVAGEPLNATPCPICMDAIGKTPIRRIEHT